MGSFDKHADLLGHSSKFSTFLEIEDETKKENVHLALIVQNLTQEIDTLKRSEQNLIQQLLRLSNNADNGECVSSLYVKLKERFINLQCSYSQLEKEKTELQDEFAVAKKDISTEHENQIKALEEKCKAVKKEYSKQETLLYNQLEGQQASACFRYDDMESKLQFQIRELAKKLHNSNQFCHSMQDELLTLKAQSDFTLESANKRIREVENQLRLAEQQLCRVPEKVFTASNRNLDNNSHSDSLSRSSKHVHTSRPTVSSYVPTASKYDSLTDPKQVNLAESKELLEEFQENPSRFSNKSVANMKRMSAVSKCNKYGGNKFSLPPLKQISDTKPKQRVAVVKKRKLYNPDNFDYLDDFEEPK